MVKVVIVHGYSCICTHTHTQVPDSNPDSNPTVIALMDTWTKQEGYPVVDMSFSGSTLTLTQRRFLAVPPEVNNPYADDG